MLSVMGESKVYAREGDDSVIEKKVAPVLWPIKTKEKGDVDGSHGNIGMGVKGLLGLCKRNNIVGG